MNDNANTQADPNVTLPAEQAMGSDTDNMALWNSVCETDPKFTRRVKKGKSFSITAINAHSQIRQATEQWGPVGHQWGYDVVYSEPVNYHGEDRSIDQRYVSMIWCDVSIWLDAEGEKRRTIAGPIRSTAILAEERLPYKGAPKLEFKLDNDAYKKAFTDALTKVLSHLGFNADVFLGQYDDNRYVSEMKQKFSGQQKPPANQKQKKKDDSAYNEPTLKQVKLKWLKSYADATGLPKDEIGEMVHRVNKELHGHKDVKTKEEFAAVVKRIGEIDSQNGEDNE